MKTKHQELQVLDAAITELGPDSYLGPWLREVRGCLESQIRSDFFPTLTYADAVKEASAIGQSIIEQAKIDAARMISGAEKQVKESRQERDSIMQYAHSAIKGALGKLEGTI